MKKRDYIQRLRDSLAMVDLFHEIEQDIKRINKRKRKAKQGRKPDR